MTIALRTRGDGLPHAGRPPTYDSQIGLQHEESEGISALVQKVKKRTSILSRDPELAVLGRIIAETAYIVVIESFRLPQQTKLEYKNVSSDQN